MSFSSWKVKKESSGRVASGGTVAKSFIDGRALPIVYNPTVSDVCVASWYAYNTEAVERDLLEYGAILFRGFRVRGQDGFEELVKVAIRDTAAYIEGATPRTQLKKGIYTSTEFPADQEIALHNELSYVAHPPRRIAFCCLVPPATGGQTQIADMRNVYRRINPALIEEFQSRGGWMLRRNYGKFFGPTVQKAFGTDDMEEIRMYCEQADIKLEIQSAEKVVTEQIRPAVHNHPTTSEPVWFNHAAFWHPSGLCPTVRAKFDEIFTIRDYPYSTYFGDGTAIPDEKVAQIRAAYEQEEVTFDWREGDILLVDNRRVAHGRKPFTGDRKIIVSMG